MKRGLTLDLTGPQLFALADLVRGRTVATNTMRALVRMGVAAWMPDGKSHVTPAGIRLLAGRVYLAPLVSTAETMTIRARYAIIEHGEVIALAYVYLRNANPLAPADAIDPVVDLSSLSTRIDPRVRSALTAAALALFAERPDARKAVDVTSLVDASIHSKGTRS